MNTLRNLNYGLIAIILAATGAHAQEILTKSDSGGAGYASTAGYSDGDLVLAFMNAGDGSANGNVLFDLGSASSFTGLAAGTYQVAGFDGSATSGQPTLGFGSSEINANETVPSTSTFWAVMGSTPGTNNQLWITGQSAQTQQSSGTQHTTGENIQISAASGVPNADSSAYDGSQTAGNYILPTGHWAGYPALTRNTVSATSNSLALYSLLPGTGGGGSSTLLGYFTLTDTAGTYRLFFGIPEPSAYASIIGAAALGFAILGRRLRLIRSVS